MSRLDSPYTLTERRIIRLLSDGMPHKVEELKQCLYDDLGANVNVYFHVANLRRKLLPLGEDIVCQTMGSGWTRGYRHVRLLASAITGQK